MTDQPVTTAKSNPPETKPAGAAPAPRQVRPLDPFVALRRQMDRQFDDFGFAWPSVGRGFLEPGFSRAAREWVGENWGAIDESESDSAHRITIELPGCEEKDLDVAVANGMITIRGEKKQEQKEEKEHYRSVGRRYGSFEQSFPVPEDVDAAKVTASFKNGVLELVLPKTESARQPARKIPVTPG